MRRWIALSFVGTLAWPCTGLAQAPTADVIAQQVATEHVIEGVLNHLRLGASPYASPAPTDIPIAVLVAAAVYDADSDLFRLRVQEAKFYLETAKSMATDKDLGPIQVRNAVNAAAAVLKVQPSDASEKLEMSRYKTLKPLMPAIVKASAELGDAAAVEGLLRSPVREALAQQADLAKALSSRRALSAPLRSARADILALIKRTPK